MGSRLLLARALILAETGWIAYTWTSRAAKVLSAAPQTALFALHPFLLSAWALCVMLSITYAMEARRVGGDNKKRLLDAHGKLNFLSFALLYGGIAAIGM